MRFLLRLAATATALWAAVELVPGIEYRGEWYGLLGVALVFGVVNAVVRPILFWLTCPLVLLTLGLLTIAINALMLMITAELTDSLSVDGFVPALLGALVISVVSFFLSVFLGERVQAEA